METGITAPLFVSDLSTILNQPDGGGAAVMNVS
jgi:hypothetical protein